MVHLHKSHAFTAAFVDMKDPYIPFVRPAEGLCVLEGKGRPLQLISELLSLDVVS